MLEILLALTFWAYIFALHGQLYSRNIRICDTGIKRLGVEMLYARSVLRS